MDFLQCVSVLLLLAYNAVIISCDSETLVHEGGKFTLTCHVPLNGVHLWFKDGVPILPNSVNRYRLEQEAPRRGGPHSSPADIYAVASNQDHYIIMRLSVDKASPMHTGEYKCSSFSPHSRRIRVLTEGMIQTNANESYGGVLLEKEKPLELQCNLTGHETVEEGSFEIKWKKGGVNLDDGPIYKIFPNNYTLVVESPKEGEHTGFYTCTLSKGLEVYNATIYVQARAYVTPFSRSMNLVQGDPLPLKCFFGGVPTPTIHWYKDDVFVNETDPRVNISLGVEEGTNKMYSLLRIENLDFDDRGEYKCEAQNGLNEEGSVNTTITVRVKDKLAALWPFLGICVEVAILCTIIFVYEKKRVKPDFEESDAEHNTENKNVHDNKEGTQDVRHRK